MTMNKQSNTYTIIYIVALVVLVGSALAFTAMSLKPRQQANLDANKMRQIMASVHITAEKGENIIDIYREHITESFIIREDGARVDGAAFNVNTTIESKKPAAERLLPVYVCDLGDKGLKYIVPVNGAGLWGPIWGYVSFDSDGSTIYGAYFAHQGETPGLGAEIEKPAFSDQFDGKHVFKDGRFKPVNVIKAGQKPSDGEDYVNAISGGTITSKGVAAMLDDCLTPYKNFLSTLNK